MALQYSTEHIDYLIKTIATGEHLDTNQRSKCFKQAIAHFSNKPFNNIPVKKLTHTVNHNNATQSTVMTSEEVNRSLNKHHTVEDTAHSKSATSQSSPDEVECQSSQSTSLQLLLETALSKIEDLENTIAAMQIENEEHRSKTQVRLENLEKENKQLKSSFGPKISKLMQQNTSVTSSAQQDQPTSLGPNPDDHIATNANSDGNQNWNIVVSKNANHTRSKNQSSHINNHISRTTDKPGRIKFQPEKVAVIENIANPGGFASDDKVRREIGKHIDKVIIDRITRSTFNPNKISVQLATEHMRDEVIMQWKPEIMFGSSSIRKPTKDRINNVGIAKGVPLDMHDEDLKADIEKLYPDTKFQRMTKGPKKERLRTIKIYFKSSDNLNKAINEGLKLESQNQYVRVEQMVWTPYVRQCTNCWRLGHPTGQCKSSEACPHCGKDKSEGAHMTCAELPKCRNCKGSHSADQRNICQAFQERLVKLINRHNQIQNGD